MLHPRRHPRAFSLIELSVVVVIAGILAIAAVPAFRTLDESRQAAALAEVERLLLNTRASAMSLGQSAGLRIDPGTQELSRLVIPRGGGVPEPLPSPLGVPEPIVRLDSTFPGARVDSITGGDGFGGAVTIWFAYDGTPELRSAGGVRQGGFTQDATVNLNNGALLRVTRVSGRISR